MSVINSQPLIGASGQGGAYNIERSLRFRSSASAYLNRTPASAGNRRTFTISKWIKRGTIGVQQQVITVANTGASYYFYIRFLASDALEVFDYNSGGGAYLWQLQTTQVFRDPSAWYHIVISVDTTQATASNRVKIYVNGVQVSSFAVANYPSLNFDTQYNFNGASYISSYLGSSQYLDGYLTEVNSIDGQTLTPSSFGETDTITKVWKPKKYTGTYGTNGFYLKFNNLTSTSTLGNDSSGNGNTWTVNNVSLTAGATYDSMTDVPTLTSATAANYCVLNPLQNSIYSLTAGNLSIYGGGNSSYCPSTMQIPPTGKFYWEFKCTDTQTTLFRDAVGLVRAGQPQEYLGASTNSVSYCGFDGNMRGAISTGVYSTWTNGDVVGIAVDGATGKVWFSKNNVWQNSGNPSADTGQVGTISNVSEWMPAFGAVAGGSTYYIGGNVNFGQQPFAYTPPSGFVALNTFNLPTSTIVAGNKYFDAVTYTGTGSSRSVTGYNFSPDLVWIKERSGIADHALYDSVRGVQKQLESNTTTAETTETTGLTALNSDGFTVGALAQVNTNTDTYVAWAWDANGAGSTNTAGSITSTVSVNASAGFSIVTWTGTGANTNVTIGHGLGVTPAMVIVKPRSSAVDWAVAHQSLGSTRLYLNLTNAASSGFGGGGDLNYQNTFTSTTFNIQPGSTSNNNYNASGQTLVAYCWSEIAGFSKFGSYTGNGSADGPFIYTGFRPKYILIKRTDSADNWDLHDTTRGLHNVDTPNMYANLSNAEGTFSALDMVSNGFKIRNTNAGWNASGGTYVYATFAENPFKNSLAR